jgi:hypothetical protein
MILLKRPKQRTEFLGRFKMNAMVRNRGHQSAMERAC